MATVQPRRGHRTGSGIAPAVLLVTAAALVIVSQSVLGTLAEQDEAWHWIQRGVVFLAGAAAGAAAALLYATGRAAGRAR
jgi:hypothetical protein